MPLTPSPSSPDHPSRSQRISARLGRITEATQTNTEIRGKSVGRNLPVAISVGALLGALVILSVWIGPRAWYPLVAVALGAAMWEVLTRLREKSIILPKWVMIALGQVIIWLSWPFGVTGVLAAFAVSCLVLMFGRLFHHGRHAPPSNYLRDTAFGVFVLVWVPLFGSFAAMLSTFSAGDVPPGLFIITFMLCVVASDVGGYAAGVMFGKHPMAPAISPSKTWEGALGSIAGGVIVGVVTLHYLLNAPWWLGIILGLALVVSAIFGDLVESQFKRELGIKDMSNLLPGHGGLMDRLDGMLPAAVITWVVLSFVTT